MYVISSLHDCVADQANYGACSATAPCNDKNAQCIGGMCMCNTAAANIGGSCIASKHLLI